jgi:hypothetical protein
VAAAEIVGVLVVTGLAAGFISGLMGVGGGIVMTPVLHYAIGLAWPDAVALSLLVIAVQSPVGVWRHHRRGAVRLRLAWPIVAGGVVGVAVGVWLEPRIGVPWLKIAFAALMLGAGYRLVAGDDDRRRARRGTSAATTANDGQAATTPSARPPAPDSAGPGAAPGAVPLAALGVAAGVVSRLLGVGGGIVTVPMLALTGIAAHVAVGTSLVAVWTNAALASSVNLAQGLAWQAGIPLAVAAIAGAPLGVRAAHALPERALRTVVSGGLAAVAFIVLLDAVAEAVA